MMPGPSQAVVSAGTPSRWYRFYINCAAHPTGVSVKSLIREADGPRRKLKNSATDAVKTNRTNTEGVAFSATSQDTAATASSRAGGGILPNSEASPSFSATATTAGLASGEAAFGVVSAGAGVDPGGVMRGSAAGDGPAAGAATANGSMMAVEAVAGSRGAGSSGLPAGAEVGAAAGVASATGAETTGSMGAGATGAAAMGPEATDVQQRGGAGEISKESRTRGWMGLIERLELQHGGGGSGMFTSSSDSSSDESEAESSDDNGGSGVDGVGGEGGDGGGGGGGADGGEAAGKSKGKSRKKVVRRHSFDYEDDFIDDSELEKAYYAKEASSKAQTVHSGFFANQGSVATVGSAGSDASGQQTIGGGGGGGESEGAGSGGMGPGTGAGADGDVAVRKKKKPKSAPPNESGKTSSGPPKKKHKKVPAEVAVAAAGRKGSPKLNKVNPAGASNAALSVATGQTLFSDSADGSIASTAAASNDESEVNVTGWIAPAASAASAGGAGTVATPNVKTNASGNASGSAAAATATAEFGAHRPVVPQQGGGAVLGLAGVLSKQSVTPVISGGGVIVDTKIVELGTSDGVQGGGGGGSGSGGEGGGGVSTPTVVASSATPATAAWNQTHEAALVRFEQDARAWIESGRPGGEHTDRVLQLMRTLDGMVRRSVSDAHSRLPYLERLSTVYGQSQGAVKAILGAFKEEDDRVESSRLYKEFGALRVVFEEKVDENLAQLRSGGEPLSPPFTWTNSLREHLHEMLRAFEAWSVNEYGGLRTKQAMTENKSLYDKLALKWPTELNMTGDCLKKMYLNEKRRIRAKANKEAAAEAGPTSPTATTTSGGTPTAVAAAAAAPPVVVGFAPGGLFAAMQPPSTPATPTPTQQGAGATAAAPAAAGGGTGNAGGASATGSQVAAELPSSSPPMYPISSFASPASFSSHYDAPTTAYPSAQALAVTPASSPSPSSSQRSAAAAAASGAVAPPVARRTEGGEVSMSYDEVSAVAMSPALSAELLPPRGFTFDAPPTFDTRAFEEEEEEEAFIGGGVTASTH